MNRGTKYVAQTINLSKPKTCVRPKIQKLVSADADSYFDSDRASSYRDPRPVTVKICSREDMQRKCQPKVSEQCILEFLNNLKYHKKEYINRV